jgi:hypothetical protein
MIPMRKREDGQRKKGYAALPPSSFLLARGWEGWRL